MCVRSSYLQMSLDFRLELAGNSSERGKARDPTSPPRRTTRDDCLSRSLQVSNKYCVSLNCFHIAPSVYPSDSQSTCCPTNVAMEVPTATSLRDIYDEDALPVETKRWNSLLSKFKHLYGTPADFVARSPGRVNIIGEVRRLLHCASVDANKTAH